MQNGIRKEVVVKLKLEPRTRAHVRNGSKRSTQQVDRGCAARISNHHTMAEVRSPSTTIPKFREQTHMRAHCKEVIWGGGGKTNHEVRRRMKC